MYALIQKIRFIKKNALPFLYRIGIDYLRTHQTGRIKRYRGVYKYTVVSAVHNVEKYLDAYFTSLTEQLLDFKNNITLLLIDDGSTDSSATIIKHWQKKYPENIIYIYKSNGGQASARNAGIPLVKTPWVTFIDPDDFVDCTYFLHVDSFLSKHHSESTSAKSIQLLSCNFIVHYEHSKRYFNKHPLRHRFVKEETIIDYSMMDEVLQLGVNAAFFPINEVRRQSLFFDERRWPQFEDAHFVLRYLQNLTSGCVAFAQRPKYYYRKRADHSSSLDTARHKKAYYLDLPRQAYLELLEHALTKFGKVPLYVQRILFYSMSFRIKSLVNAPSPPILSDTEEEEFFQICRRFFSYIDEETILNFPSEINGMDAFHKAGMLACFANSKPSETIVSIHMFDNAKRELCFIYFSADIPEEEVLIDGKKQTPIVAKSTKNTFLNKLYIWRMQLWVSLPPQATTIEIKLNGINSLLSLGNSTYNTIPVETILDYYAQNTKQLQTTKTKARYSKAWLFMDRDVQADDNAEHLYRYVKTKYPEQLVFFALRSSSKDWPRLQAEGFNLLDFGSLQHEAVLYNCAKLISSHADKYVTDYFPNLIKGKHFIWLQHGVTKDNLSRWINGKKIDLIITTTQVEYESIVADGSFYIASQRNVALTGFPRHDALISAVGKHQKTILVMPTWRKYLAGERIGKSNKRILCKDFMQSHYAQSWSSFLCSNYLKLLADQYKMKIVFFPHMNIQPYLPQFQLGQHIVVYKHGDKMIQDLFKEAAVLITDYSSVAFEMALINKSTVYYQFDKQSVISGEHIYLPGYFDYIRDGFGPVVENQESLFNELELLLQRNCTPDPIHMKRMKNTFPFRDGRNCERVYLAIKNLDDSH